MNNEFIILRGIPGSGKSDLANELLDLYNSCGIKTVRVSADDYFINNDGEYIFDVNKLGKAHATCRANAMFAIAGDVVKVIVENTNTTEKELKPYLDMAANAGYRVRSLIVENRHGNESIHNVPTASLEKMKARFSVKL